MSNNENTRKELVEQLTKNTETGNKNIPIENRELVDKLDDFVKTLIKEENAVSGVSLFVHLNEDKESLMLNRSSNIGLAHSIEEALTNLDIHSKILLLTKLQKTILSPKTLFKEIDQLMQTEPMQALHLLFLLAENSAEKPSSKKDFPSFFGGNMKPGRDIPS